MTFGTPQTGSYASERPARGGRGGQWCNAIFTDLIDRLGQELYRFARQLTGNGSDADDLYQETLLKAFRAFDRLPDDANHRAWLYRIASNTFISDRRKHARCPAHQRRPCRHPGRSCSDHARALDARDLLHDVEQFVHALPPKQRVGPGASQASRIRLRPDRRYAQQL